MRCASRQAASSSPIAAMGRLIGRVLVKGMPFFLNLLGILGTAAMVWVGGGIILHGFEGYGYAWLSHLLHDMGDAAALILPAAGSAVSWLVQAAGAGIVGVAIGAAAIPLVSYGVSPLWRWVRTRLRRTSPA